MYYEFYLDVYFLENLFMDLLIIRIAGKILRQPFRISRWLLAGLIGAFGACMLVIMPLGRSVPVTLLGSGVLGILMVKAGFGIKKKMLFKGILVLYLTAFVLGGIFQMLFPYLPIPVIVTGGISFLVLVWLLDCCKKMKSKTQEIYQVTLSLKGKTATVQALRDTGNRLKEPYSGRPVSVSDYLSLKELIDGSAGVMLIPYHSVGKSSGLLPGITFDYMIIAREDMPVRIEHPVIAVSKEPVSTGGEYQMILNPVLIE